MNRFSHVSKTWTILPLFFAAAAIFLSSSSFAGKKQLRGAPAESSEHFQTDFRNAAAQIPIALQKFGYTNFGRLYLSEMNQRIASIKVVVANTKAIRELNDGDRSSAHWTNLPSTQQIAVSLAWWRYFDGQQHVLALHEVLGEFGFEDDQYWISTSMWLLTLPEAQILTPVQRNVIANWISQNAGYDVAAGGTVIGVGGGGESASIWYRMGAIRIALIEMREASTAGQKEEKWEYLQHMVSSMMTSHVDGIEGVEVNSDSSARSGHR